MTTTDQPDPKPYLLEIRLVGGSAADKPISIPFDSALAMLPLAQAVLAAIAGAQSMCDHFAAKFAPALIAKNTGCGIDWKRVAKDAYEAEDAMLKARNQP